MSLQTKRRQLDACLHRFQLAREITRREQSSLDELTRNHQVVQECLEAARTIAQELQRKAHQQISSVVTRCLRAVFQDQAYEFHIEFVQKRNRTEAELKLTRHGMTIDDPLNSSGGGVIDVAAFALRVACLILAQPPRRKVLFLDEPFRFVSAEYRPAIEQLLQLLSQELEIQIVMVTHIADLVTEGTVIEL